MNLQQHSCKALAWHRFWMGMDIWHDYLSWNLHMYLIRFDTNVDGLWLE